MLGTHVSPILLNLNLDCAWPTERLGECRPPWTLRSNRSVVHNVGISTQADEVPGLKMLFEDCNSDETP